MYGIYNSRTGRWLTCGELQIGYIPPPITECIVSYLEKARAEAALDSMSIETQSECAVRPLEMFS